MKRSLFAVAGLALFLAAGSAARAQTSPNLTVVPPQETAPAAPASTAPVTATSPAGLPMQAAPAPSEPVTPGVAPVRHSYSSCHVDGPYIAMTFDDGPSAKLTPELLDMLKQRNIKVTFFLIGQNVVENPDIVRRAVAEGHEVGNHSWSHPALNKLSEAQVDQQLTDTNDAIFKACGVRPKLMRPPYGATNLALDKKINDQYGMKVILWEVDPLDWKIRNSDHVYSEIMKQTRPGDIILSHDIHATTVAAMPRTLDALLAKGYKFVTVSELIAMDHPLPPKPASTPVKRKSKKSATS